MNNGMHALTREQYDSIDRVHWSHLKDLARSPAHFAAGPVERETAATELGVGVHLAILEPKKFAECAVWRGAVRRGKEWEAFRKDAGARLILTEEEYAFASEMAAQVRRSPQAQQYLSTPGVAEHAFLWTVDGVDCKALVDWYAPRTAIVDIKTTVDASPSGFGAQVARYSYLGQAGMYYEAVEAVTDERLPYVLIAIEKARPFVVQCYRVPAELMMVGRSLYCGLLRKLAECEEKRSWPGYAEHELELKLPKWALSEETYGTE